MAAAGPVGADSDDKAAFTFEWQKVLRAQGYTPEAASVERFSVVSCAKDEIQSLCYISSCPNSFESEVMDRGSRLINVRDATAVDDIAAGIAPTGAAAAAAAAAAAVARKNKALLASIWKDGEDCKAGSRRHSPGWRWKQKKDIGFSSFHVHSLTQLAARSVFAVWRQAAKKEAKDMTAPLQRTAFSALCARARQRALLERTMRGFAEVAQSARHARGVDGHFLPWASAQCVHGQMPKQKEEAELTSTTASPDAEIDPLPVRHPRQLKVNLVFEESPRAAFVTAVQERLDIRKEFAMQREEPLTETGGAKVASEWHAKGHRSTCLRVCLARFTQKWLCQWVLLCLFAWRGLARISHSQHYLMKKGAHKSYWVVHCAWASWTSLVKMASQRQLLTELVTVSPCLFEELLLARQNQIEKVWTMLWTSYLSCWMAWRWYHEAAQGALHSLELTDQLWEKTALAGVVLMTSLQRQYKREEKLVWTAWVKLLNRRWWFGNLSRFISSGPSEVLVLSSCLIAWAAEVVQGKVKGPSQRFPKTSLPGGTSSRRQVIASGMALSPDHSSTTPLADGMGRVVRAADTCTSMARGNTYHVAGSPRTALELLAATAASRNGGDGTLEALAASEIRPLRMSEQLGFDAVVSLARQQNTPPSASGTILISP
jgi:hypothetical protein